MEMSPVVPALSLETLPRRRHAIVAAIDWTRLGGVEAQRLREFGFDEGVAVEVLHRASLGRGPIACRIGRMTVALRRTVASAVHVHRLTPPVVRRGKCCPTRFNGAMMAR